MVLGFLAHNFPLPWRPRARVFMGNAGSAFLGYAIAWIVLADAELVVGGRVTVAALVLFGTRAALGRLLAQTEIVLEYRSADGSTSYQQRQEFREGFFLCQDRLWELINLLNDLQLFREGLFAFAYSWLSVAHESDLTFILPPDFSSQDQRRAGLFRST